MVDTGYTQCWLKITRRENVHQSNVNSYKPHWNAIVSNSIFSYLPSRVIVLPNYFIIESVLTNPGGILNVQGKEETDIGSVFNCYQRDW